MGTRYDIIIIGGNVVGASLALALGRQGKRVLLLEGQGTPFSLPNHQDDWDQRIYAISPSNQQFLHGLNAWPDARYVCDITSMHIYGDTHGEITFNARAQGIPTLAWVLEHRRLLAALWHQLDKTPQVVIRTHTCPVQLQVDARCAQLTLDNGKHCQADLVVGADGAHSWVRQQMAASVYDTVYGHSAVVANFRCERPHQHIARQWFTKSGILAWLPLVGHHISMVWSTPRPEPLMNMTPERLADTVAAAGRNWLGQFELATPPAMFTLCMRQLDRIISQRTALAGDAAHTLHPLAGQGVNLGLHDAQQLARLSAAVPDPGNHLILRRYERLRRTEVRTMQAGCHGLYQLFNTQLTGLPWLRNTGLNLVHSLAGVKRQLVRYIIR